MYISGTDYYNSVPVGTLPVLGYFSTGSITGRKLQYEFEHNGKRYKRDIADTRANNARDRRHNL